MTAPKLQSSVEQVTKHRRLVKLLREILDQLDKLVANYQTDEYDKPPHLLGLDTVRAVAR